MTIYDKYNGAMYRAQVIMEIRSKTCRRGLLIGSAIVNTLAANIDRHNVWNKFHRNIDCEKRYRLMQYHLDRFERYGDRFSKQNPNYKQTKWIERKRIDRRFKKMPNFMIQDRKQRLISNMSNE